jgi:hypothetical protein
MKYVIQWKSKLNGRAGRGTKLFEKEEAERLVADLNREYPQIEHKTCAVQTEKSGRELPHSPEPVSRVEGRAALKPGLVLSKI